MKVVSNAAENGAKFQEIALAALENDANKGEKVKKAENLLRRIVKSGSDGESFKAKAKAEYKYATAFAWNLHKLSIQNVITSSPKIEENK